MTVTFDTLTYSKRLRQAGVPKEQADAHAGAALYLFKAINPNAAILEAPEARSDSPASPVTSKEDLDRMVRQVTIRVGGIIVAAFAVCTVLVMVLLTKATPPI